MSATKEQIDEAKEYFTRSPNEPRIGKGNRILFKHIHFGRMLRDALSTAERERDEERKAHDIIASMAAQAGAEDSDGTSMGYVRSLIDKLKIAERERDEAVGLLREARAAGGNLRFYIWLNRKTRHIRDDGKTQLAPPCVQAWDALLIEKRIDAYLSAHFHAVDIHLRDAGEAENKGFTE